MKKPEEENRSKLQANAATVATLDSFFESMVKITLAGFGGSIIGMAQQANQNRQAPVAPVVSKAGAIRHAPPVAVAGRLIPTSHLPQKWAISCALFVVLLETCRTLSPTSVLYSSIYGETDQEPESSSLPIPRHAATTIADYALGGSVAGLAGALARRKNLPGPPSSAATTSAFRGLGLWGLGVGLSLGLLAGVAQAGIDELERQAKNSSDEGRQAVAVKSAQTDR